MKKHDNEKIIMRNIIMKNHILIVLTVEMKSNEEMILAVCN